MNRNLGQQETAKGRRRSRGVTLCGIARGTQWKLECFESLESGISEKALAPLFSTLAWKIPWMEEPGRLQSMGSLRAGHD